MLDSRKASLETTIMVFHKGRMGCRILKKVTVHNHCHLFRGSMVIWQLFSILGWKPHLPDFSGTLTVGQSCIHMSTAQQGYFRRCRGARIGLGKESEKVSNSVAHYSCNFNYKGWNRLSSRTFTSQFQRCSDKGTEHTLFFLHLSSFQAPPSLSAVIIVLLLLFIIDNG